MMAYAVNECSGPVFIRYPRGCVPPWELKKEESKIVNGKSRVIFENGPKKDKITIFAAGISAYVAKLAAQEAVSKHGELGITIYDARFIKPIDKEAVVNEAKNSRAVITVEENNLCGGFGSAVLETIVDELGTVPCKFYRVGIKDRFVEHGTQAELRAETSIDVNAVRNIIYKAFGVPVE